MLRRAYRAMAKLLHPDKCKLAGAEAAFQRVNEAFELLIKQATAPKPIPDAGDEMKSASGPAEDATEDFPTAAPTWPRRNKDNRKFTVRVAQAPQPPSMAAGGRTKPWTGPPPTHETAHASHSKPPPPDTSLGAATTKEGDDGDESGEEEGSSDDDDDDSDQAAGVMFADGSDGEGLSDFHDDEVSEVAAPSVSTAQRGASGKRKQKTANARGASKKKKKRRRDDFIASSDEAENSGEEEGSDGVDEDEDSSLEDGEGRGDRGDRGQRKRSEKAKRIRKARGGRASASASGTAGTRKSARSAKNGRVDYSWMGGGDEGFGTSWRMPLWFEYQTDSDDDEEEVRYKQKLKKQVLAAQQGRYTAVRLLLRPSVDDLPAREKWQGLAPPRMISGAPWVYKPPSEDVLDSGDDDELADDEDIRDAVARPSVRVSEDEHEAGGTRTEDGEGEEAALDDDDALFALLGD